VKTVAWSLELATRDALVAVGVPRRFRTNAHRARVVRVMQPEPLLDEWEGLLKRLPEHLAGYARDIFVIAPPRDHEVTPYAAASGDMSRRIVVPREFYWLHRLFAKARAQVEGPFQEFFAAEAAQRAKEFFPPDVALARMRHAGLRFAQVYSPPEALDRVLDALLKVTDNQGRIRELPAIQSDLELNDWRSEMESRSALRFALGHELAHHLMNHTWARPNSTSLPTEGLLREWLASLGVAVPRLSRMQTKEVLCDGFAIMLGHEWLADEDPHLRWMSSVMLAGGSLTSLVALDLFGEATLTGAQDVPMRRLRAPAHPSFEARAQFIAEVLLQVAPDHPGGPKTLDSIRRQIAGNTGGYALLVLGCAAATRELLRRRASGA
jgi:hypothetical protein